MAGFVKVAKSNEIQPGQGKMAEVEGIKIAFLISTELFTPSMILVPIAVGRFRKGISMGIKLPVPGMGLYLM